MRRLLLGGTLLLAGLIVAHPGIRWRAHVVALKAAGKIPALGWSDLARMLHPSSGFWLEPLRRTRNPHRSIINPDTSAADVAAGARAFEGRCAVCHSRDARGGTGPALVGKSLTRGSSDWALYRAISRGFPGTPMQGLGLPVTERWQIVAFLQARRRDADSIGARITRESRITGRRLDISAAALLDARADSADWLMYSGAYDGQRHSRLSQINRANVSRLRLLWLYQADVADPRFETSPLVVDGIMFLTTPGNGVRALDAETGAVLWSHDRELPDVLSLCCGRVNRGLAILGTTLYMATLDAHLVALDAATGAVRWDVAAARPEDGYSFTSAPLVVKDLVVIGSAGGEWPTRGFIDAYDARTGVRRWRFHTIPEPGQPGNETWSGDSWKVGGAPAWMTGSYDPILDLIYWGTGNPNPDFNGDNRLGDNLHSNSVVALDPDSGSLRWAFQFTPHDENDWDSNQVPVLVEGDSAARPLLLTANKNAFYYVLDRATGRYLRAREFARQTWAFGIDSAGRPMRRPGTRPTSSGTQIFPSTNGGGNWWSPTYSPRTRLFYVPSYEREDVFYKGENFRTGSGRNPASPGQIRVVIRALEAETGARRWEHEAHAGIGDPLERVGGLLSTAGDLVIGAGADQVLALDAISGRRLWSFRAGGAIHAAPITYLVRGRQRITVAAGRALLTFGIE
jgi:alcohol dehydrogenase (cytochrome c)